MAVPRRERRVGKEAIPDDLKACLNSDQMVTLVHMEGYGWTLEFVRRPLFLEPVPILRNPDTNLYAALNEDGSLNPEVHIR